MDFVALYGGANKDLVATVVSIAPAVYCLLSAF
jgi:hypothetical protein